jgi:hypothetical protein
MHQVSIRPPDSLDDIAWLARLLAGGFLRPTHAIRKIAIDRSATRER